MKKLGLAITATLLFNAALTLVLFNHLKNDLASEKPETEAAVHFAGYKQQPVNEKPVPGLFVPENFVETSKLVTDAVVNITVKGSYSYEPISGGSGVIISRDGFIITNNHVVDGSGKVEVTLSNKRSYKATVIGKDPTTDLALLKIDEKNLPVLHYANSDEVEVGQWVLAVGNPFNLTSTVTAGIVSATGRNINILQGLYSIESFIQTDAVVNPGNSGGALVNLRGELVGINSAIMSESGGYEGYSFAIPANLVKKIIRDLKEYGEVKRALLGIRILDVNEEVAFDMNLPEVSGILVRRVDAGSSAEKAGIEMNDVIVAINGQKTNTVPELQEQVARFRPGDSVSVDIIRNGKKLRKDNVVLKGIDESNLNR
jgi:S1-C subfamily serine protease